MTDEGEPKILGFTKREAEILIISHQVMKPNPCTTNGCTARPNDLVRIGAYPDADTARTQYAALRARVMALDYLTKPESQGQSAGAATAVPAAAAAAAAAAAPEDCDNYDQKGEATNKSPFLLTTSKGAKPAGTLLDAGSNDKNQRNPFLLTEEEKKKIGEPALPGQAKLGEGVVDDDLPTQEEWDAMGDSNAW